MQLLSYLKNLDPDERERLAEECQTTWGHLRNVMYGLAPCSPVLAARLELHSQGAVTRPELAEHLRDDWRELWPELAGKPRRRA